MADDVGLQRQPGGRRPAPAPLHLVQDLINTRDIEAGTDTLDTPDALDGWLGERGLVGGGAAATGDDLHRTRAVREALRAMCTANHDGRPPADATVRTIEDAARRARLTLLHDADGWRLAPTADSVDAALGAVLATVHDAMAAGRWHRLKACRNHGCRWVFWDASPAGNSRWCSMAICGNRAKLAAWRDRQGTEGSDD